MADTVKVNFAVLPETAERLEELCKMTFRTKSDLVDWLVAEKWLEVGGETKEQAVQPEKVL